ncbi:MAG: hypothetical protein K2P86_04995 [Xanthobacteraceae bacterium]|nr:hypothetical protein [Xanthobacteraceae bacterium]
MNPVLDRISARVQTIPLTDMDALWRSNHARIHPVLSEADVTEAEVIIGFKLPPLLRDIYQSIGNGGFGPGNGLLGLRGGHADDQKPDVVSHYLHDSKRFCLGGWKPQHLRLCHWGCAIYSLLNCTDGSVLAYDPNLGGKGPYGGDLVLHARSLDEFFLRWVDGEDLWKTMPFTGEPRIGYLERGETGE